MKNEQKEIDKLFDKAREEMASGIGLKKELLFPNIYGDEETKKKYKEYEERVVKYLMKNDLKNSAIVAIERYAKTLKTVSEDVIKLTNYKSSLETKILDTCEIYDIKNEELLAISVQNVPFLTKIPLKTLLDVFPNTDIRSIIENVVTEIKIDLNATEENLRFSGDLQEPIIKNIIKQLEKLSNKKIKKVVVK